LARIGSNMAVSGDTVPFTDVGGDPCCCNNDDFCLGVYNPTWWFNNFNLNITNTPYVSLSKSSASEIYAGGTFKVDATASWSQSGTTTGNGVTFSANGFLGISDEDTVSGCGPTLMRASFPRINGTFSWSMAGSGPCIDGTTSDSGFGNNQTLRIDWGYQLVPSTTIPNAYRLYVGVALVSATGTARNVPVGLCSTLVVSTNARGQMNNPGGTININFMNGTTISFGTGYCQTDSNAFLPSPFVEYNGSNLNCAASVSFAPSAP